MAVEGFKKYFISVIQISYRSQNCMFVKLSSFRVLRTSFRVKLMALHSCFRRDDSLKGQCHENFVLTETVG